MYNEWVEEESVEEQKCRGLYIHSVKIQYRVRGGPKHRDFD
jgi:hypothetical protein